MSRRWLPFLVCIFLVFAGCGDGGSPDETPAVTEEDDGGEPTVTIAIPGNGAVLKAGNVRTQVTFENFQVVDRLGDAKRAGEGHIHFYLDVKNIPTAPGKPAVTDDEATYHAAASTSHTWKGVKAGKHTLGVQLVNNDHTPIEPPVTAEVSVTAE